MDKNKIRLGKVRLGRNQQLVLEAWDNGHNIEELVDITGLKKQQVQAAVGSLVMRGLITTSRDASGDTNNVPDQVETGTATETTEIVGTTGLALQCLDKLMDEVYLDDNASLSLRNHISESLMYWSKDSHCNTDGQFIWDHTTEQLAHIQQVLFEHQVKFHLPHIAVRLLKEIGLDCYQGIEDIGFWDMNKEQVLSLQATHPQMIELKSAVRQKVIQVLEAEYPDGWSKEDTRMSKLHQRAEDLGSQRYWELAEMRGLVVQQGIFRTVVDPHNSIPPKEQFIQIEKQKAGLI